MKLTGIAADELSSLRSIVVICLALVTANASYRVTEPVASLEPRHGSKRLGELAVESLKRVDIEAVDEVPVGAHLISPRRYYIHHGIYLGAGTVAHYSGFSGALEAGPIEVTDLEHFASGRAVWIIEQSARYPANEVARRARSRLGENRYSLFANNCEHFCTWCLTGESYSAQVGAYWHRPREFLATITVLNAHFIA